ncbi:MAG: hypothetical protein OES32_09160 [Acidobacteriota bacterium]|nr:hypothetical protein [Acidobacteriota bacterium]MDH3523741.1 hypothetical protein [Acidobacteriota bacterium]
MDEDRRPVRFRELLRALVEGEVEFVIVGGVAAVLEGAPVATFDLDVVYSLEESNVGRLVRVLADLEAVYVDPAGRRIQPDAPRLRGGGHHLLRSRYGRLDVLGSVGERLKFEDLLPRSRVASVHGMEVSVLTLEALIGTKEAANRPKDRAVLDLLRQTLAERQAQDGD